MAHPERGNLRHTQNFLTSSGLVDQLLAQSSINAGDLVLDIGAGPGLITERLADRGARVLAVEKDPVLARRLRERFAQSNSVTVCEADCLEIRLPRTDYKVFANLPFNITTKIVAMLTGATNPPLDCYLGIQREAAERFMGEPRGTLWATLLKPWFELTVVHRFQRVDFTPKPQVDVVMLRLRKRGPPLVGPRDTQLYRDFVTFCFRARRRCLRDTLRELFGHRSGLAVARRAGLDPGDTPSTISFEQWLAMFARFKEAEWPVIERVKNAERRLRSQQRDLTRIHRTRTCNAAAGRGWSPRAREQRC